MKRNREAHEQLHVSDTVLFSFSSIHVSCKLQTNCTAVPPNTSVRRTYTRHTNERIKSPTMKENELQLTPARGLLTSLLACFELEQSSCLASRLTFNTTEEEPTQKQTPSARNEPLTRDLQLRVNAWRPPKVIPENLSFW